MDQTKVPEPSNDDSDPIIISYRHDNHDIHDISGSSKPAQRI